jgi:uncharacterized protein involved in exopolysaccharide biosynthesis
MQTEAAPREPFTVSVLFRYKFTIFAVAVFVILGGYVRIVTQPKLFEATARLAVRFSGETLALNSVDRPGSFRLPLLEEEVKAYMTQLKDRRFIEQVLNDLPSDSGPNKGTGEVVDEEESTLQAARARFIAAYYSVRKAFFSALDVLLFSSDILTTDREQRVNQIMARLEAVAGEEASHIIVVNYQNANPTVAANLVNALASKFIEFQKRKVKRKDEAKAEQAVQDAEHSLHENRRALFEISKRLKNTTPEDAIRFQNARLEALTEQKSDFQVAKSLLDKGVIPYDKKLPLESPELNNELERDQYDRLMQWEQIKKDRIEHAPVFDELRKTSFKHLEERRRLAIERDKNVVEAHIASIESEIQQILNDESVTEVAPMYTKLVIDQDIIKGRLAQTQSELVTVRAFNNELDDENVSENVALWQRASIPPFPVPQYREIKLLVVIVLGLFAGCAAALVRHHIRPKAVRRALPRSEEEADVPIVILPDDGRAVEKDIELDITFPAEDGAEEGSRPRK